MKLSDKAHNLRKIIEKAIEDHGISKSEYELVIHSATDDGHFDTQERALLRELQEMIENKTVRIIP